MKKTRLLTILNICEKKNTYNEFCELDKLVKKSGRYPFILISSLYYGTNKIEFFPLRISYDKDFFDIVEKFYKDHKSNPPKK